MIYIFDVPFSENCINAPSPIYILKGILTKSGFKNIVTKDLNLLFIKYLLSENNLKRYLKDDKILWKFIKENKIEYLDIKQYIFKEIKILINKDIKGIKTLEELLEFDFDKCLENKNNPLLNFFSEVLNIINKKTISVFLISIRNSRNLLPALFLSKLIKKINYNNKIIWGGSYIITTTPANLEYLLKNFACIDYISNIQAEVNLEHLVKLLLFKKGNISSIPNIFYQRKKEVNFSFYDYPKNLENVLIEKRELNQYYEPRNMPINNGVGCYWNRCVYCNYQKLRKQIVQSPNKVVDFIEDSIYRLNIYSFILCADALREKDMVKLCDEIIKRNLHKKIKNIISYCRPDVFDIYFFQKIARSRINKLAFGIESFSNNLLKKMRKGTNINIIINDIKKAHSANIYKQVNLIYNFPTITQNDINNNLNSLYLLSEYIDKLVYFSFELYYETYMFSNKEKFNIYLDSSIHNVHYVHNIPFNNKSNNINKYYLFMLKIFQKYFNNREKIKKNLATYRFCMREKKEMKLTLNNFIIDENKKLFIFQNSEFIYGAILNRELINFLRSYNKEKNFIIVKPSTISKSIIKFIEFCIKESLISSENDLIDKIEYEKINFYDFEKMFEIEISQKSV